MIIGISGKKRHGKDTVYKIIQYLSYINHMESLPNIDPKLLLSLEECLKILENKTFIINSGWENKKFAEKLKQIVAILIGCKREDLENDEFKNTPLPAQWDRWYYRHTWGLNDNGRISDYYATEKQAVDAKSSVLQRFPTGTELIRQQLTPRLLLQWIGTEGLRDIVHPEIHVLSLFMDYKEGSKWVITDVRFPNEADVIKQRGGIVIRVENDRVESTDTHPSEIGLDDYQSFDAIIPNNATLDELRIEIEKAFITLNITL